MRENNEKDCNINDSIHDVPPEKDCGHPVMEGPGVNPDGSLMKNPDGETEKMPVGLARAWKTVNRSRKLKAGQSAGIPRREMPETNKRHRKT